MQLISFRVYRLCILALALLLALPTLVLSAVLLPASYAALGTTAGSLALLVLPFLLIAGFRGAGREVLACTAIWALALPAAVLATTHAHTSPRARALEALAFALFLLLFAHTLVLPVHALMKVNAAALIAAVMPASPHPHPPRGEAGDVSPGAEKDLESVMPARDGEADADADLAYEYVKRTSARG